MGSFRSTSDPSLRRRSGRIETRLRVIVSGTDMQGQNFEERTETLEVSKYGARITLRQELKMGATLSLERPDSDRKSGFRMVYQAPPDPATGLRDTGIEFLGVDSFWGIQFPPERGPWN
jgi:transcription elongation GreA/GreB family factor